MPGHGEHLGPGKEQREEVRLRGGFRAMHRVGENGPLLALFL